MRQKRTHEQYVSALSIKAPNINVIGVYINSQTSILHQCKLDGHIWSAKPNNILQGTGCPKCSGNIKKTHEQYVNDLCNINANIEVVEPYIDAQTKILHKCKLDGHEWMVAPTTILSGYGCPKCKGKLLSSRYQKTHEQYLLEVFDINPNIEVVGQYAGCEVNILHRCRIDGYEWMARPANILNGKGCPKCARNIKRTLDEYIDVLKNVNSDITVISEEYINNVTPILHKCKVDGHEWMAAPNNILQGKGCPICKHSHGEQAISKWLQDRAIKYISQKSFDDCRDKNPLPFDFYVPHDNLCIEYDGEQHFRPVDFAGNGEEWAIQNFQTTQFHDEIKTRYCTEHNINLLRIAYFQNIEEELKNFYSF